MKDYKNLKLQYKLGGLGPSQDPEVIKEKVRKMKFCFVIKPIHIA